MAPPLLSESAALLIGADWDWTITSASRPVGILATGHDSFLNGATEPSVSISCNLHPSQLYLGLRDILYEASKFTAIDIRQLKYAPPCSIAALSRTTSPSVIYALHIDHPHLATSYLACNITPFYYIPFDNHFTHRNLLVVSVISTAAPKVPIDYLGLCFTPDTTNIILTVRHLSPHIFALLQITTYDRSDLSSYLSLPSGICGEGSTDLPHTRNPT
ncbi:MAG: hypothetical protein Q9172_001618 [Xanthocarpia lactea]